MTYKLSKLLNNGFDAITTCRTSIANYLTTCQENFRQKASPDLKTKTFLHKLSWLTNCGDFHIPQRCADAGMEPRKQSTSVMNLS